MTFFFTILRQDCYESFVSLFGILRKVGMVFGSAKNGEMCGKQDHHAYFRRWKASDGWLLEKDYVHTKIEDTFYFSSSGGGQVVHSE